MDRSTRKYTQDAENRPGTLSVVFQTVRAFAKWLTWFFTLSAEERLEAGIYRGGEGRDG